MPTPTRSKLLHFLALIGVLLVAVFLHFYRLDQEGYANLYYAAAVKSMLTSWHNFFFVSFDSNGFVAVDKPPLGLWIQAASALLFGFSGWSLLFPQALAGVLSVALLYHLVRRVFGPMAALIAALVLALTPISIAANRNNTMDSLLVLTSLLAAWAISLAAQRGQLRWLSVCALFVGVGFNIKMLQAFLVLPAFYLFYLIAPPIAWWKRIAHLAAATVVLAVVSLAWVVAVDLTPPDQRPFVGSSTDNTVTELIIGHNGLARLIPTRGGRVDGGQADAPNLPPPPAPSFGQNGAGVNPPPFAPDGLGPGPDGNPPANDGGAPGRSNETGDPGLFRLFNEQLAGQATWLLPLALIGLVVAVARRPPAPQLHTLALWGAWLIPQIIFFSIASLFHRYYLEMMAPAIAALVGAGLAAMWESTRRGFPRNLILPAALLLAAATEITILAAFPTWSIWLSPIILAATLIAAIGLLLARPHPHAHTPTQGFALTLGVLALLIAPAIWSLTPVMAVGDSGLPYASPDLLERPKSTGAPNVDRLVDYLTTRRTDETYLLATLNAMTAAPVILATAEPVMALGGFSGGDRILTADQLSQKISQGDVRFFLLPAQRERQSDLTRWVADHCAAVQASLWQNENSIGLQPPPPDAGGIGNQLRPPPAPSGPGGPQQLYDCGGS